MAWLEEPLLPDQRQGYQQLNAESPVPIAAGEHEYLAEGFQDAVDHKLYAILQPDITWCGGLTSLLQIMHIAEQTRLRVVPHHGSEPYALHAIAATQPDALLESGRRWLEGKYSFPNPINGQIRLRDEPGFGVHVEWPE